MSAESSASDIEVCIATDAGCQRPENQDSVCFVRSGNVDERVHKGLLAIVADGMGGHQGGRVASALAIEAIRTCFLESEAADAKVTLRQAFEKANQEVLNCATQDDRLRGMGTTATAVLIRGDQVFVAHVGDSRAYRCVNGGIVQLTEDDTLVKKLVRDGMLSEEQAEHHPDRNLLINALGTKPEFQIAVQRCAEPLQEHEGFLLCSDGLHDLVHADEIALHVNSHPASIACQNLLTLALARGASDNVSVIVLKVSSSSAEQTVPITRETLGLAQ